MVRDGHYKYVFGPKPRVVALYDLQADPEENKNLADMPQHADLVRKMHRRLLAVMKADGDPFVAKLPDDPLKQP
jgi:arylsulfatase A-like enzyme